MSTGQLAQIFIGSFIATKFAEWVDRAEAAAAQQQPGQDVEGGQGGDTKTPASYQNGHADEGKGWERAGAVDDDEEQEVVDGVL